MKRTGTAKPSPPRPRRRPPAISGTISNGSSSPTRRWPPSRRPRDRSPSAPCRTAKGPAHSSGRSAARSRRALAGPELLCERLQVTLIADPIFAVTARGAEISRDAYLAAVRQAGLDEIGHVEWPLGTDPDDLGLTAFDASIGILQRGPLIQVGRAVRTTSMKPSVRRSLIRERGSTPCSSASRHVASRKPSASSGRGSAGVPCGPGP